MEISKVIHYPLMTEKSMKLIDENKMIFIVDIKARKEEIVKAVESLYDEKVINVRTLRTMKNQKKAYITFEKEGAAAEMATTLGMI